MPLSDYQSEVSRLLTFLNLVRETLENDAVTVQQLQVFVACMCKPEGMPQAEIQRICKLTPSATTANVANLSSTTIRKQPGPGLLEQFIDPAYRVARTVRLTPKGEKAALRIMSKIYKGGKNE